MKLTKIFMAITFLFLIVSAISAQSHDKADTTKMHHKMMMKENHDMDKSCCKNNDMKHDGDKICCKKGEAKHEIKDCKSDSTNCPKSESTKNEEAKIWNKVCPVQGEEVDTEAPTVEYKGKLIGFCCPGCDKKFRKDPERYMKNLSEDGSKFVKK